MSRTLFGMLTLAGSNLLHAQMPPGRIVPIPEARRDSMTACPSVMVFHEASAHFGMISTEPIILGRKYALGYLVTGRDSNDAKRTFGISVSAFSPNDTVPLDLTVTLNGGNRIDLKGSRPIAGTIPQNVMRTAGFAATEPQLQWIATADSVMVRIGSATFPLTRDQTGAVRTLLEETSKPFVGNRIVKRNCATGTRQVIAADPLQNGHTYFSFQVEQPARAAAGNPSPVYPPELRKNFVEGEVTAQFTVLENGRADMDTFKVIRSTNNLFSEAVRDAVRRGWFAPAQIAGKPVKQLVQLPFVFKVNR